MAINITMNDLFYGSIVAIIFIITFSSHHILWNLIKIWFNPRWQPLRNHLVRSSQLTIVESLLPILNLLGLILFERFLYLCQSNRSLSFPLLGFGASISRIVFGGLQVVDPRDSCKAELFSDLSLITFAYRELCSWSIWYYSRECFLNILDVE